MQVGLTLRVPAVVREALGIESPEERYHLMLSHLTSRYRRWAYNFREDADQVSIEQGIRNALMDAQMGNLYAQVFPQEWRMSTQSTLIGREPCDRANELLTHLSRVLPVDDMAMGWDVDERPMGIPVWRLGVSFDEEWTDGDALASCSASQLVMACLLGIHGYEDVQAYLMDERQFPYVLPEPRVGEWVDGTVFRQACRTKKGGCWHKLTDAIWVVGHSTGNFMLDYDDDTAQYFWEHIERLGWTPKGYRRLKQECERATVLLKRLSEVCAWLDGEPQHWPEVFAQWIAAHRCLEVKPPARWMA